MAKRWTWISVSVAGIGVVALGVFWFLQGSDLVHVEPILCAADCEPVAGHKPAWQVAGGGAVIAGTIATLLAVGKLRR